MIESNVGDDVLWVGGVWGMVVWGIDIKLEYYPQMCIGDGFIFN